ncbi:hypothetical protein [Vibrio phage BONAISHI]|nr:hypothetical protein [Vibrio phage BONAISHI]
MSFNSEEIDKSVVPQAAIDKIEERFKEVANVEPAKSPLVKHDIDDELEWRMKQQLVLTNINMTLDEVAADPVLAQKFIRPYEEDLSQTQGMWILNPPYGGARNKRTRKPLNIWGNIGGSSVIICGHPGEDAELVWQTYNPTGARRVAAKRAIENGIRSLWADDLKKALPKQGHLPDTMKKLRKAKRQAQKQSRKKNR